MPIQILPPQSTPQSRIGETLGQGLADTLKLYTKIQVNQFEHERKLSVVKQKEQSLRDTLDLQHKLQQQLLETQHQQRLQQIAMKKAIEEKQTIIFKFEIGIALCCFVGLIFLVHKFVKARKA